MSLSLNPEEQAMAQGDFGEGAAMAMRIVAQSASVLGATRLVPITSAHIDGCLYHGPSTIEYAQRLVSGGAKVRVPSTLNVGALDLLTPDNVRISAETRKLALQTVDAYRELGCQNTWTCAPYQAAHRPQLGEQVAWGESNAVVFCNSVLGARTNRYGDFLDIACAIAARAPYCGLHLDDHRRATVRVDLDGLSPELKNRDVFWPVFGAWYGRTLGPAVGLIHGAQGYTDEDRLKSFGAAAASFGETALFHMQGVTPEARDGDPWDASEAQDSILTVTAAQIREALGWLSTTYSSELDAVALGSPHFSLDECQALLRLLKGRKVKIPVYINTGRHVISALETLGHKAQLLDAGIALVADTCIVVTPILADIGGVLMTNSGKFAHYAPGNTGYEVVYGSLEDCVESAVAGRVIRDDALWK